MRPVVGYTINITCGINVTDTSSASVMMVCTMMNGEQSGGGDSANIPKVVSSSPNADTMEDTTGTNAVSKLQQHQVVNASRGREVARSYLRLWRGTARSHMRYAMAASRRIGKGRNCGMAHRTREYFAAVVTCAASTRLLFGWALRIVA